MKKRLLANFLAFLILACIAIRYIYHYELWWAQRGRDAFLQFQASFFDHGVATQQISHNLLAIVLVSTIVLWLAFEVASSLILLLLHRLRLPRTM